MSDVLQGARTKDYVKEDIPGIENSGDKLNYVTLQDVQGKRAAMDVLIHGVTVASTGHTIDAGSARRLIKSTAHGAKVGYFIRPTTGNSIGEEIPVIKIIDADTLVIAALFDIAIGDTFDLIKPVTPNYTANGDLNVVVNGSGPIEFNLDGASTVVSEDTVTPSNNRSLPTKTFGDSGFSANVNSNQELLTHDSDALTELQDINIDTSDIADSVASIDVKTPALVSGSVPVIGPLTNVELRAAPIQVSTIAQAQTATFVEDLTVSTTPKTFVAPAGAFAALIETDDTNDVNIRVKMGGVASTTSGIQFQGGRSEIFKGGSDISYCAESGSGYKIAVQWFVRT